MKKFLSGLLVGAVIFSTIGAFAASYIAEPASFKVLVNGKELVSDPPALVVEGRTYLPLRAIGDALGVPVEWNAELGQAEVGNSAPVADANQYSRTNPAPINTVQTFVKNEKYSSDNYTATLRVMEVLRGDEARKKLEEGYSFSITPDTGYEFVLAKVAISMLSVEGDGAHNLYEYDFRAFSSNNEEMPITYKTAPDPQFKGKLYAGGNSEGWIVLQVKPDDPNPKLAYELNYDGTGGVWFALS